MWLGALPKIIFSPERGLGGLTFWFDVLCVHVSGGGAIWRQHKAMRFCLYEADFRIKDLDQQRLGTCPLLWVYTVVLQVRWHCHRITSLCTKRALTWLGKTCSWPGGAWAQDSGWLLGNLMKKWQNKIGNQPEAAVNAFLIHHPKVEWQKDEANTVCFSLLQQRWELVKGCLERVTDLNSDSAGQMCIGNSSPGVFLLRSDKVSGCHRKIQLLVGKKNLCSVITRHLESEDSKGGLSWVWYTHYRSDGSDSCGEEPDLWLLEYQLQFIGLSLVKMQQMLWSSWQKTPCTSRVIPADEKAASIHAEE